LVGTALPRSLLNRSIEGWAPVSSGRMVPTCMWQHWRATH